MSTSGISGVIRNRNIINIAFIGIQIRPKLVKTLVIVIRAPVVKVYDNYAPALIIFKVNRNFSFLPTVYFP